MTPQEPVLLVAGCKSFDNYPLFKDFLQYYCQKLKNYIIVTDNAKPYSEMIRDFVADEYHHVMSLPIAWPLVKSGDLTLQHFQNALAESATHAILFWDGSTDFKLLHLCNQFLVDMRVVIYRPGLEASSEPFL